MKRLLPHSFIPPALGVVVEKVASHLPKIKPAATPVPAVAERAEPVLADAVPTPVTPAPDRGPWLVNEWSEHRVVLQSDDFEHDVALIVDGDFGGYDEKLAYAQRLANWLNERLEQDAALGLVAPHRGYDARYDVSRAEAVDVALVEAQLADLCDEVGDQVEVAPFHAASTAPAPETELAPEVVPQPNIQAVAEVTPESAEPEVMPAVTRSRRVDAAAAPEAPTVSHQTAPVEASPPKPVAPVVPFQKPSANDRARTARYGCHCELPPGEAPGPCVIDLKQPQYCGYAMKGVQRDECQFWQPIVMKL